MEQHSLRTGFGYWYRLGTLMALGLGVSSTALGAAAAEATLSVTSNWGQGYCAQVRINAGASRVDSWSIVLNTQGSVINNLWNGSLSGATVTPQSWNRSIAPNGTVDFGFCANGSRVASIQGLQVTGEGASVGVSSSVAQSSAPSSAAVTSVQASSMSRSSASSPSGDSRFSLVFRDDFNFLDGSRWELMDHSWPGNLAIFSANTVTVANGMMKLALKPSPAGSIIDGERKPYLGAEVRSRATISYGRVSARAKLAKGSAVVSALVSIYTPWPAANWNEFDIESLGKNPREIQYNAMVYNGPTLTPPVTASVTPTQYPSLQPLAFDSSEDFHIYTIEWTPTEAIFLIDGEVQHRWSERMDLIGLPQNILLTIWASNAPDWAGPVTRDTVNAEAIYDWVEVWRYTP